jgi:drug/metabolite transporter (DMT)-like permease
MLLALLSAFLFSLSTPFSKVLLSQISPFQLAGLLYLGGAIGVFPFVLKSYLTRLKNPATAEYRTTRKGYLIGAVFFGGILGPVFMLFGLKYAMSSSVALWLNMELIFTAILGHLFFKDRISRFTWFSIAAIITASILISFGEGPSGLLSALFVSLACFCWGLDNNYTSLIDNISPSQSTFIKGIVAGAINLLIGCLISGGWNIPIYETFIAITLGCFAYGLSITLYITSAQSIGAVRGQIIFSTAPFIAVLLSVLFLKEKLTAFHIAAMFIYAASLLFVALEKHDHEHTHEDLEHVHSHRHDDEHHDHIHEEKDNVVVHSHFHKHKPTIHAHFHFPDLHHRH